jgi:hypothetical protein
MNANTSRVSTVNYPRSTFMKLTLHTVIAGLALGGGRLIAAQVRWGRCRMTIGNVRAQSLPCCSGGLSRKVLKFISALLLLFFNSLL